MSFVVNEEITKFFENPDPELLDALLNPTIIDSSLETIKEASGTLILPLMICDNPETQLSNVPNQLNFIVPLSIKNSEDPYIINLKNDLNMYRKTYEKYSKQVNQLIDKTKISIKNLYQPLKKLRNEIRKYSEKYIDSIKALPAPLENKMEGLNQIDYKKYPQDMQKKYLNDKKEVIQEVNDFIKEVHQYCETYKQMNQQTLKDAEKFVQDFTNLAMPANELSTFMKDFFKVFEKSSSQFNDLTNKEKINKALQKIKAPIAEFPKKSEYIKQLLIPIKNIEESNEIEKMSDIQESIKKIMENLKQKSKIISNKIIKIREKYGETSEVLKSLNIPDPEPVDIKEISKKLDEQKVTIQKVTEEQVSNINKDVKNIINQTRLDLLFIMDVTNSMDLYLNQTKEGILDMIKEIQKQCAGIEIDLGFIGYRDFNDLDFGDTYVNEEFTTDYVSIENNIKSISAEGGGDIPEDLCGAFDFAKQKKWQGKSRFAILVTDSPCHGLKYHDFHGEGEDNFPDGDKHGRNIEDYVKFFAENEISLFCLKINSTTDKMFKIFEKIYEENKKKYSNNEFVVDIGTKIFNFVTENAVKTFQNRKNLQI